jgi:signal transduction histidine kinase
MIFETGYRRKDGATIPVEVSARSLLYEEGERIVAFVRDITERKRAEQERERLIHELETKNTELTQFTYTVSHDLKSPLVTINGFLGYLEKDTAAGDLERVKRDRQRIEEAVSKMQHLLTELLELSRIGRMTNSPETVAFGDLVHDALEIVHGRLSEHGVTVRTQPNLPLIHGDRQRLTEVLQNLLDNAAKYMGDQAKPVVEIGQRGEATGQPIFFVRDNGIGIAPEHHERIFGLFNKLDPQTEGTGIGLALVKKIVEVHGGRIWVESEVDQGSTFYFTLGKP